MHAEQKRRVDFSLLIWTGLLYLAACDVLVSYLAASTSLAGLARPWVVIAPMVALMSLINPRQFRALRRLPAVAMLLLLLCLLIGVFTVAKGSAPIFVPGQRSVFSLTDVASISSAVVLGAIWTSRVSGASKLYWLGLSLLGTLHIAVCFVAIQKWLPSMFPVLDSPYMRDGNLVSRVEISTDQTRQALYLLFGIMGALANRRFIVFLVSLTSCAVTIYVIGVVQSRSSTVIAGLVMTFWFFTIVRFRSQNLLRLALILPVVFWVLYSQLDALTQFFGDLMFRFERLDSSFGGRATAIQYLFNKLADPAYWVPQGDSDFYSRFKASPHSFPTMVYLFGGLIGILVYPIAIVFPLASLGSRIISGSATVTQQIVFLLGIASFLFQITQPVLAQEIFWLIAGMVIGATGHKQVAES